MTNLDSILESKDITLPTKVHVVKAMVFPVGVYRCSWVMRFLAAETWVVPGSASPLVGGALFWGGWLHCPGFPDLLLTCCCVGLILDTAGFRVQGV